jgi:hypothetical protein
VTRNRRLSARPAGVRAGLVAAVAGILASSYFVVSALAAPAIPAPAITSSPANPTTATTAAFTYSDSQSGVRFRCSFDGSGFTFCQPGGVRYTGLFDGSHTFSVEAYQRFSVSPATTYTWRVDTHGPAITLTFPRNDHVYGPATWAAGCPAAGICGSAADPSGVQSVAVAIYQSSSRRYWTGSAFSSSLPDFNPASGTTAWRYDFTPPQVGLYDIVVRATDDLGNLAWMLVRFRYDITMPPAPRITRQPANPSADASPEFEFTDRDWPHVRFWCSLDSGAVQPCTGDTDHDGDRNVEGERQYENLPPGQHCFAVYVTSEAGNRSAATTYRWTIEGASATFTVGGNLPDPLYPGTSEPLDLTFTNPSSSPITIAPGGVGSSNIAITTSQAGCAAANFEVSQGLTTSVTVPASQMTPVSLAGLSIPQADWPVITMIDTGSNQDACVGAPLTLTYSGIEATG